jgi:hypothetical protein
MAKATNTKEKMIKELENQIRDLKKKLAAIRKNQSVLRLQPCLGDLEIREKDEKFAELETQATVINETLRDLTSKRQLMISPGRCGDESPD